MTAAAVDVLIPAYNAGRTIRGAIASIQNQTMSDLRIVVVDDGSTDDTGAVLAELAAEDARIVVITTSNGGIVDALNLGLARCEARIIARHDGDDIAAPHRLATQLAYLDANPDCIAVSCSARHIDNAGRPMGSITTSAVPTAMDPSRVPAREPYLLHPFLTTYRRSLEQAGGYRYVFHAEDTDLYWRLAEIGRLHNQDLVLGDYRMHGGSLTGASILNGRVAAMFSQLAALAAARRRSGRADISFPREALSKCNAAGDIASICAIGVRGLDDREAGWLRSATAAKLLGLGGYRPYELELSDCRFIRHALETDLPPLSPDNRVELNMMWSGSTARLAASGRFEEAFALCPPHLRHHALARTAFRMTVPAGARRQIQRILGRSHYAK